jgi:hypothetical protein
MPDNGIMEEIRELLSQGKSSGEVIRQGYAPGTVYKVQRQLRLGDGEKKNLATQAVVEVRQSTSDAGAIGRIELLESEHVGLRAQVAELDQEVAEVASLQSQVEKLQRQLEDLSRSTGQFQAEFSRHTQEQERQVETLQRQVKGLEETESRIGLLVFHLDAHHRESFHGFRPDPADRDFRINDAGYQTLLRQLREALSGCFTGAERRQQLGLLVRLRDLALQPVPSQTSSQRVR